jgi:Ca2+-binding RTX toxin-like protein
MPDVTVLGAGGSTVTVPLTTNQNLAIAQAVAANLTASILAGNTVATQDSIQQPLPPGKTGEFVKTVDGLSAMPPGYSGVVNVSSNAIIFGSGDTGQQILSGTGNLTFFSSAGSGTLVGGGGDNSIFIAATDSGGWDINTDLGINQIIDFGTGASSISPGTGDNFVQLGGGHYTVNSTGDDTVVGTTGAETVGASSTVSGAGAVVVGNVSKVFFINNGQGASTVLGDTGSDTVFAGFGGGLYKGGTAGNNLLQGGFGSATLQAGGANDTLFAGPGSNPQVLIAASGNETLNGLASSGADTFYAGTGNADITLGFGKDTVVFTDGSAGGADTVNGFTSGPDKIQLNGYPPTEVDSVVGGQTLNGAGVTISLTDGTTVLFASLTQKVTNGDFIT